MTKYLIALAVCMGFPSVVQAAPETTPLVSVMAYPSKVGTVTRGEDVFFTKTFDVVVLNGQEEPLDLSDGCYMLSDSDGNTYGVDTIDEKLLFGKLSAGDSIKSFIQFSAGTDEVYDASIVKFFVSCGD